MESCPSLKLIIEKEQREVETLEYSVPSIVKIGRVVRGNTITIKDAGISSKHICIQFDNQLRKWTVCDLNSTNGTFLNGKSLKSNVPAFLSDGDSIILGDFTSMSVKFEAQLSDLGLGSDENLGENGGKKPVEKRNLKTRGVNLKNKVETRSCKMTLRSSRKKVSFVSIGPKMKQARIDEEKLEDECVRVDECKEAEFEDNLIEQSENLKSYDLETMTLGDFFDYLEVNLRKEIYEKSEQIISCMQEKARKCREFKLSRTEKTNAE